MNPGIPGPPVTAIALDYGGYAVTSRVSLLTLRMAGSLLCRPVPPSRNGRRHEH